MLEVNLLFTVSFFFLFSLVLLYSCQPGVQGDKCTECMDGYKNFSSSGCFPCNCDKNGSLSEDCNEFTHQCPCKVSTETTVTKKCCEPLLNKIQSCLLSDLLKGKRKRK